MDVVMARGDSLLLDVTVTNSDGTIRDISSGTLTFEIYDSPTRDTHVLSGTAAVVSGPAGTASAYLQHSDTSSYTEYHVYYYVITLTEHDGTITDVQDGKITIK